LSSFRNPGGQHEEDSSRDDDAIDEPARILVAEDDSITREVVTHVLAEAGYHVDAVANGQEALAAVISGNYGLVLMDARMPILSGLEATRLIRDLPENKRSTPIVMMTATAFKDHRREMQDTGITAYLPKGVKPQELLDCVRLHLGGEPKSAGPDWPPGLAPVLDLKRVAADQKFFSPNAMPRFLYHLEITISEFLPGLAGETVKDPAAFRSQLHKIAGISGTLGCTALCETAKTLEAAAVITGPARERFIETALATVAAIRRYRKGHI
jgi:CheY-like chemotaxis protein